ncbi:MAG: VOC family protein [Dehalococcoidales bacterium]|nr:VOC family protein [Dehalococcoidales bacterium]
MPKYEYDHVHLLSTNAEDASNYYQEMFGATVIAKRQLGERVNITLDIGGSKIMILNNPDAAKPKESSVGVSNNIHHFAIGTDDLDAAVEELKAKGAKFEGEIRQVLPNYREIRLIAPDNVPIELFERK